MQIILKINKCCELNLFIFLLFSFINLSCQTKAPINTQFNHLWILEDYHNSLLSDSTLFIAYEKSVSPIKIIFIDMKNSEVILSTLNEGFTESFIIKKPDEILINKSLWFHNPYSLSLMNIDGKTKLVLTELNGKVSNPVNYVSLDNKYYVKEGFTHFINDKYFTGLFLTENGKMKVQFFSDGKLEGIPGFNHYVVPPFRYGKEGYNQVALQKLEKIITDVKTFHWRKEGKSIFLYSLSDESPNAEIGSLYMKLILAK